MADRVSIEVGSKHYVIEPDNLPPIGTRIMAHKHLYDGGTSPVLEVTEHEWHLDEGSEYNDGPAFSITIKTRIVN